MEYITSCSIFVGVQWCLFKSHRYKRLSRHISSIIRLQLIVLSSLTFRPASVTRVRIGEDMIYTSVRQASWGLLILVLLISSHFEHHGSVSVARAQCKCIGHGPRSRFRGVRSEMKSTVAVAKASFGMRHSELARNLSIQNGGCTCFYQL